MDNKMKAKGADKIGFDGALSGTLDMESDVISFDQLAVILASDVVEGSARVGERKVLQTDGSKKVILQGIIPVTGSISVFSLDKDKKSHKDKLTFTSSTVSQNTEITISSSVDTGTDVVVYYLREYPKTKKIVVKDNSTAPNYYIYGDTLAKDEDGANQVLAIKIPNLKAQRSIELGLTADNPSTFKNTFTILPDENGEYFELAFIGDEGSALGAFLNADAISFGDSEPVTITKK